MFLVWEMTLLTSGMRFRIRVIVLLVGIVAVSP